MQMSAITSHPTFTRTPHINREETEPNNTPRNTAIAAAIGAAGLVGIEDAYVKQTTKGLVTSREKSLFDTVIKYTKDNKENILHYSPIRTAITGAVLVSGIYLAIKASISAMEAISQGFNQDKE